MKTLIALLIPLTASAVSAIRVPNGGIQPQVVERDGMVHMLYFTGDPAKGGNGTTPTGHLPRLYTRISNAGTAFEPECNLIHNARGLDGGGSLGNDSEGNVSVFWQAPIPGTKGEEDRRVWMARSTDDGKTFEPERLAFDKPIGACAEKGSAEGFPVWCTLAAFAKPDGSFAVVW